MALKPKSQRTWKTASEVYGKGDPLRGHRRKLRQELANEAREDIFKAVPKHELAESLGGKQSLPALLSEQGDHTVMRLRTEVRALCLALAGRYEINTGRGLGSSAVLSAIIAYGLDDIVSRPEFAPTE